jgi:dimethylaniline monooxygenase (N-oxide forming)
MAQAQQPSVAVIGLGGQGLVTVKNLLEQDYRVTGFDRNDYVGGVWHSTVKHQVSALPTTVVNVSRERACFTDFPFPAGTNSYPTSSQVDKYLNDYADHFNLRSHLRLSTSVTSIVRDEGRDKWLVKVTDVVSSKSEDLYFDKVIMASGPHVTAKIPKIEGHELFAGEITHSIAFKDPKRFRGKRVIVVGASNSGGDTATSLIGIASQVYLSHGDGAIVLPRYLKDGNSLDHTLTYQKWAIKDTLDTYAPRLSVKFIDSLITKIQKTEYGDFDPEWRFHPSPSLTHKNPTVNDFLVPALRAGTIKSLHRIKRVLDRDNVEMEDGTTVQADGIIFCTGYGLDYSVLGPYDPTLDSNAPNGHQEDTPQLYRNVFSLQQPQSLAFIGIAVSSFPAFMISDLQSMAIAQLWSKRLGTPSLPPRKEMEQCYAAHLAWAESVRQTSPSRRFLKTMVRSAVWLPWVSLPDEYPRRSRLPTLALRDRKSLISWY